MEHLLDFFVPKSYKLDLNLDKYKKTLQGTVKIDGRTKAANLIKLHSNVSIDYIKLDGEPVDYSYDKPVLSLAAPAKTRVTLELGFHTTLKQNMQGAYLSTYQLDGKEERIISTQFESHYARDCFPCVDEPAAKATFDLSISVPIKNGAEDTILANTAEKEYPVITRENGVPVAKSVTFKTTPRMSTYLLAFVVGRFNVEEGLSKTGVKVRTFAPLNRDKALLKLPTEIALRSLEYYDDIFQTPYPLEKLDQVAIPDFEAGAMENWGLVTYRESQFLCQKSSSSAVKKSATLTITHELSHQWFGNLVTMKWWNDLWLNESFATIMEYYCTDFIFPEWHVWDDFFTSDCLAALYRDALSGVQAVREDVNDPAEIATLFDPCIVYAKGAHLMLMLIRMMREKFFFRGIKAYFEKKKYKNADADDLWAALEPFAKGFSVRDLMHAWLTQPGYPVVTDEAQQRFLLDGSSSDLQYPIPEVKDDMSGHYLINLSGPEFADALKNFKTLSHEQKLRLLIDRMLLADTPIVSSASLIPLLEKFKLETSAPVWSIIDTIISKLTIFYDFDSKEEKKFKAYLYNLVKDQLKTLGLEPQNGEDLNTLELRQTLMGCALYSKNPEFIDALCNFYNTDLSAINPDLRPFVFAAKMWRDEAEFYPEVFAAYQTTTDPELKSCLRGALTKPRLKKNIDLAFSLLTNTEVVKPQDHLSFLLSLRRWRYTRDRALKWLFENWEFVYKLNGEKTIEDYPRYFASTILKQAEADQYFEFFTPLSSDPVLARTLHVAKNSIDATLNLIKSDAKAVCAAINKLPD
ncbi:M1 family metallopeptidase [Candidatus Saccharibacteria bacterium]|nr:M1 family metallopeptidase [Candidatus Saccharibacteria bacterium]